MMRDSDQRCDNNIQACNFLLSGHINRSISTWLRFRSRNEKWRSSSNCSHIKIIL